MYQKATVVGTGSSYVVLKRNSRFSLLLLNFSKFRDTRFMRFMGSLQVNMRGLSGVRLSGGGQVYQSISFVPGYLCKANYRPKSTCVDLGFVQTIHAYYVVSRLDLMNIFFSPTTSVKNV